MKDFFNRIKFTYSFRNIKNMYAQYPRMTAAFLTGDAVLVVIALALLVWGIKALFNV